MKNLKLSLVVPYYNEEGKIEKTAKILISQLNKHYQNRYELIFVDDGSNDNSRGLLIREIKDYPQVRLLSYKKNKGRGYALSLGFNKAVGENIGYIDSDLEINPKYVYECMKKMRNNDVVVVSKNLPTSKVETTFLRRWASLLYNLWIKVILGSLVSDHQGGLKIFRREVIKNLLPRVNSKGWLFDTELLYISQKAGFKICEVPIKVSYGFGKIRRSMISDFLKSFIFVFKLKLKYVRSQSEH